MEVAYFKIKGPKDKRECQDFFSRFLKVLGKKNLRFLILDDSDNETDNLFIFNTISVIENVKTFFIKNQSLLEFEIKTKDYLIFKKIDPILFEDENYKILLSFLKKNLTVDDVLDKINYSGIESLNDLDHKVLKNKK